MFNADFNNYWYELAEKDFALNNPAREYAPDEYYHAYGALYAQAENDSHNCKDNNKTANNSLQLRL